MEVRNDEGIGMIYNHRKGFRYDMIRERVLPENHDLSTFKDIKLNSIENKIHFEKKYIVRDHLHVILKNIIKTYVS